MKAPVWIKLVIYLPLIMLADYLLMVLLGCASCLFGFGEDYYCGEYCIIGKVLLGLSAAFFIFLVYPDLVKLYKKMTHA